MPLCASAYVGIDVLRKFTFYFVCLKIWNREVLFLWWTVDWNTELRKAIHGGRYLRVRHSVSGILEF